MKRILLLLLLGLAGCATGTPETNDPVGDFAEGYAAILRGDFASALRELKPLAEQGDATSQNALGTIYTHTSGRDVPQDYAEAAKWYRMAAEQGHTTAQANLANIYTKGQGVPQDYVQAHLWWNLAGAKGSVWNLKNRDSVAEKMTPAQIAEAEKLAREWKEKHQKCTTHTLSVGNDSVAAPGVVFSLKNIGPKSAMIVIDDGEIMTLDAGKETTFVGYKRFDYYVKLTAPGDTTTIEFCQ